LPAASLPVRYENTPPAPRKYSHKGYTAPPPACLSRSRTTPQANTCMWTYRSDECGYTGGAVADEFDKPTTDIRKDRCSKCMRGCELRRNVGNFGGFLSINKLSQ
ncbi:phage minor tail protein L, partial [Escherichia coli]